MAVAKKMFERIQDYKKQGYTQTEVLQKLKSSGYKVCRQTLAKYYTLDEKLYSFGESRAKGRVFDKDEYRTIIITALENCRGRKNPLCISSIYDEPSVQDQKSI